MASQVVFVDPDGNTFKVKAYGKKLVCVDMNGIIFALEDKIFLTDSQGSLFGIGMDSRS